MNTVKRGVFTGAAVFGFLKAANMNRKVNRALRRKRKGKSLTPEQEQLVANETVKVIMPDGRTILREEPTIPLRSSVKGVGIAGGGTAVAVVQLIQSVDWPGVWFDQFVQTDMFVAGLPLLVAFIASYVTKSPIEPGKL